jgi:hypothetical protein
VAFIVFLLVLSSFSWLAGSQGPLSWISTALQFVLIPALICAAARLKLVVSPSGIEAKSSLHKQMLFNRAQRSWSDLHAVRIRKLKNPLAILRRVNQPKHSQLTAPSLLARTLTLLGRGWGQQGFLVMDFTSGGMATFPLAGFSPRALEDLFLVLSMWADPMSLNPDVIALQRDILTGQTMQLDDTYTKMWEESLAQRFEVTNFVPLMGGQNLRNGELKILMLLACGGMSSVYLARNRSGERLVVKELSLPEGTDGNSLTKVHEMFAREAQILSKLNHPHIVKVLDHFVENGRNYLILEFIAGLTLRQQVQLHGPFREVDAVEIAKQLSEIFIYLHGFTPPIIHRDLTPDNLVIDSADQKITLIDFGAANEFIGSATGTLVGKQCYIPPEQFRGQAVPQSDLYALGATMHFLLTGEDPEPITPSHPMKIKTSVTSAMDNLVAKLTAAEPEDRIQSAETLLSLLNSHQCEQSISGTHKA